MGCVHDPQIVLREEFHHRGKRRHLLQGVGKPEHRDIHHTLKNPPPWIQTITGKEASVSIPEGLNTFSVRQSSDIFGCHCYGKEMSFNTEETRGGLQAVSMGYRNY